MQFLPRVCTSSSINAFWTSAWISAVLVVSSIRATTPKIYWRRVCASPSLVGCNSQRIMLGTIFGLVCLPLSNRMLNTTTGTQINSKVERKLVWSSCSSSCSTCVLSPSSRDIARITSSRAMSPRNIRHFRTVPRYSSNPHR